VVREFITSFIRTLYRERVFILIMAVALVVFLGAVGFSLFEPGHGHWYQRFGLGLWWATVTLTTVGYGDVTPVTVAGRIVGVVIMLGGVVTLSLVTATVASVFIERKFRQERGLEAVKIANHILILGWPEDGETLLDQLLKRLPPSIPLVLVNRVPPEQMEALRDKYPAQGLYYLRGDYSREEILLKASVKSAIKAIILAERQPGETVAQVDQRTLFTALTLKAMHPKLRILAELLRPENRSYLERAGAEEVLIRGQYDRLLDGRGSGFPRPLPHIYGAADRGGPEPLVRGDPQPLSWQAPERFGQPPAGTQPSRPHRHLYGGKVPEPGGLAV
jgi:voltage-gated potassium channel